MSKITTCSAGAAFEVLAGGVLSVRFTGLLTGAGLQQIKAMALARRCGPARGHDVRAFVADFSAAAVALDCAELAEMLDGDQHGAPSYAPGALVTRCELVDMLTGHAAAMALRGVRRRVFVAPDQAIRWAQRLAAQPAL